MIVKETPNWQFVHNYFWDVLPNVTTELQPVADEIEEAEANSHLKPVAKNTLSTDDNVCHSTSDFKNLDLDFLLVLQLDFLAYVYLCGAIEVVNVTIGKKRKIKFNKVGNN